MLDFNYELSLWGMLEVSGQTSVQQGKTTPELRLDWGLKLRGGPLSSSTIITTSFTNRKNARRVVSCQLVPDDYREKSEANQSVIHYRFLTSAWIGAPGLGSPERGHPDLFRFVPISPFSSNLFRFAFLVFWNAPICSDWLRFHLFRFVFRTNQNKSGKPLSAGPFCKSPIGKDKTTGYRAGRQWELFW